MSKYQVSPSGAWLFQGGHKYDAKLAEAIRGAFVDADVKSIVDIGCGDGAYTWYLTNCYFDVSGYDGNPDTDKITYGIGHVADFSQPQYLGKYEAVLSLEVGEHIPVEYQSIFLDNLARHASRMIIMSWAVPGQGGHGHVNEQPNEWVIDEMDERGWWYDREASEHLRANTSNCYWFQNTVMVFRPE